MAHFCGTVQGDRGEVSRTGTKNSGVNATTNGWDIGVTSCARHNDTVGADNVAVRVTGGRNDPSRSYGEVYAYIIDGTEVQVGVNKRLLEHCDPDTLVTTIMQVPELVKLLRGRIFIEGKADGD